MATPTTITIGGQTFDVTAFALDQLQVMVSEFRNIGKALDAGGLDALRTIISAAVRDQIDPDALWKLKTNLAELLLAVQVIATTSGLVTVGEAMRGMDATLTGTSSTPASASVADGTGQPSVG